MRARVWCVCVALAGAMVLDVAGAQEATGPAGVGGQPSDAAVTVTQVAGKPTKVSFRWEGIAVEHALAELFKATNQPHAWAGTFEESVPLTATMTNVDLKTALDLICQVTGLTCQQRDGVWVVSPGRETVTVGGVRLPVVGAIASETGAGIVPFGGGGGGGISWMERVLPDERPHFGGEDILVDLDVTDATVAEVAIQLSGAVNAKLARLCAQTDPAPTEVAATTPLRLEITAHDSLKNLRVTAKVYRWPVGEVLDMLLEQAGLKCVQEKQLTPPSPSDLKGAGGIGTGPVTVRLHLVPEPVLQVTGPMVARPGATGIGGYGGSGSAAGSEGGGGGTASVE